MKRFKQVCSLFLALTLIVGLMPGIRLFAKATAPTVGDNVLHASYAENGVTVDGALDAALRLNVPLSATMKYGAAWDWENLYLAFTDTTAPEVTALTVNGQAVTDFGTAGTGVREIQIPLADVNIKSIDFAEGYALTFTVGEVTWEGKLVFDTTEYSPITVVSDKSVTIHDQSTKQITADSMGVVVKDTTSSRSDKKTRWMYNTINALTASADAPTVVEFDVLANAMPNGSATPAGAGREFCDGLSVSIRDDDPAVNAAGDRGTTAFQVGLIERDGTMYFVYWADNGYKTQALTKNDSNQYHIRAEYYYTTTDHSQNAAVSAVYYVNGKQVAKGDSVRMLGTDMSTATKNIIQLTLRTPATDDDYDVTVSNMSVTHPQTLKAPSNMFLHASYAEDGVNVNGTLDLTNEPFWRRTITLSDGATVSAAWDWENLYLAFAGTEAPAVSALAVNGKTVTATGEAGTTAREIKVSLSDVGITAIDLTKEYDLSFNVGNVIWTGKLIFDTSAYATNPPSTTQNGGVDFSTDKWIAYMNGYTGENEKDSWYYRDLYYPSFAELASSLTAPTIIEMDVTVNYLPDGAQYAYKNTATNTGRDFLPGGLAIVAVDDVTMSGTNAPEGIMTGLYKADGNLVLGYWDNSTGNYVNVPVDTYEAGKQYHLRIEYSYNADGVSGLAENDTPNNDYVSAKYFVNGRLIATADNVKRNGIFGSVSNNTMTLLTQNTTTSNPTKDNSTDVTIANLSVTHPQVLEAPASAGEKFLFASYAPEDVVADGKLSDAAWKLDVPLSAKLTMGAAWDWDNLYLGFSSTSAAVSEPTSLKIGGKDVQFDFTASDNTAEAKIPLTEILSALPEASSDFADSYPIALTIDGITWEGKLVFDTRAYMTLTGGADFGTGVANGGQTAVFATSGSTYATGNKQYYGYSGVSNLAASSAFSTVIEFELAINNLPTGGKLPTEVVALNRDFCYGGIGLTILDDKITFASGGQANQAFQLGFFRDADGLLRFGHWADGAYHSTAITEYETGTYFVRVEYNYAADGTVSAKYFINGVLVTEGENVRATTSTNFTAKDGKFIMVIAQGTASSDEYKTVKEKETNAAFSNMSVSKQQVLEKPEDLAPLTKEYIFGRIDLNHVRNDLPLIKTFTGESGKVYDLEWVIGDTSVVTETGKVTRHATEAQSTTITLKLDGADLWTVTVTVDPMSVKDQASSANVDAAFSASKIVIDGILSEEGWRMGGRVLDSNGHITAEYAFQWNQTTLFAAVDFVADVGTLELELNSKSFIVENGELLLAGKKVTSAEIAVNNGVVELAIPMSVLGMGEKVSEYGKSMDISVTAAGFTGAGQKLALTGIDWFVTDNRDHEATPSGTKSNDAEHGVDQIENGWRLYDLYKEGGTNNKVEIRSYILYNKLPVYVENFEDRVVATRVEFDFLAKKMPVQDEEHFNTSAFSNSGFSFSLGDLANANKDAWTMVCGIMNTVNGLEFVVQSDQGHVLVPLGKKVGDQFSIGVEWYNDNRVDLYIDGVLLKSIAGAGKYTNSVGNASLCVNMKRVKIPPTSSADDFDVYMTNIAMGKVYNNEDILNGLTFDDIKGSNPTQGEITMDLVLPAVTTNGQLDVEYPITWTSSNEAVITTAGKVTRPETGVEIVTLTATLSNGVSKSFELIVHGMDISNEGVLHVIGDLTPASGKGHSYSSLLFTLDTDNNSIIRDLGEKQDINFVELTDGDDKARLNTQSLSLWVSDDNETYTQVESFKLLQRGNQWYLYDFQAEGQYVKVHYTHFDGTDADFTGAYGDMIKAGYEEVFGYGVIESTTKQYTLTNTTGKTQYDYAWTISKEALGITGSDASIRISLDGELLYHYVDGGNVIVRVPEVTDSVTLTVRQSNSNEAIDIANKEAVHEVTYGYLETYSGTRRWVLTLPAGTTFPDGSELEQETIFGMGYSVFYSSTDGGRTWTQTNVFNNAPEGKTPVDKMSDGGFIYDSETGRIMFQTYHKYVTFNPLDMNESHMESFVIASDDGGKTWYLLSTLPCACMDEYKDTNVPRYALSYTDGIQLSTYDGEDGTGIDFVFPLGVQYDNTGCFASRVVYTRDAGKTWEYSETPITYPSKGSEGGCSEAYIVEREDGVLLLHVRCQAEGINNFKVSYSYDHGVTWTNDDIFTDYYATNGQAMIKRVEVNGEDTFMAIWQGNNLMGGTSYIRSPLNVAVSLDEGDTFGHIQNLASKTFMEGYDYRWKAYMTNQSVAKFGGDNMIITYRRSPHSDYVTILAHDFDQWYTRTKGAYDDFEHGVIQYEGWSVVGGAIELSSTNARDKYSMKISGNGTSATRSVPYLQDGKITMEIYAAEGAGFTLALQSGYSPKYSDLATPVRVRVENGKLYLGDGTDAIAELKENDWNTLTFDLALTQKKASVTVNGGSSVEIPVETTGDAYVCYITFGAETEIYVDNLLVIDNEQPVVHGQTAAEAVIEKINAIGTVTGDSGSDINAARAAYDALTDEQKSKVTNYAVLTAAESEYENLNVPKVVSRSISLKGNIALNYYMTIPENVANDETAYMLFTLPDGSTKQVFVKGLTAETDGRYVFSCSVAAREMTGQIKAQFFYGDSNTKEYLYNIQDYANQAYGATGDANLDNLLKAMLRYGGSAQRFFGHNTNDQADENSRWNQAVLDTVTDDKLEQYQTATTHTEAAQIQSVSLLLRSETILRVYFTVAEGTQFTVWDDSTKLTPKADGDRYYVDIENIAAQHLETVHHIQVKAEDSSVIATVDASALSYCYIVLTAEKTFTGNAISDELVEQVKALYLYNQAANAYFDNLNKE